jgi:hypothetical protein
VYTAAISATGLFDSVRTKVDAIDIPSITFSAKVAAAFSAYIAIEGVVSQKSTVSPVWYGFQPFKC